ncbi:MAG TPA: hypothetical protein ENJ06_01235 [Phycisphaeraceae bacterium]|nr:hypothetical protein [Phycisphaeraceae bacterium]
MRLLHYRKWSAALGLLLSNAVTWGQDTFPNYPAPTPNATKEPKVWVTYLIVAVLVGAVLAISLTPSKRGHQD